MAKGCTIFDKIWDRHVIAERDDGESLLYIDRLLCQETQSTTTQTAWLQNTRGNTLWLKTTLAALQT